MRKNIDFSKLLKSTSSIAGIIIFIVVVITAMGIASSRNASMGRAEALVTSQANAISEVGEQAFITIQRVLEESISDTRGVTLPESTYDSRTGLLSSSADDNPSERFSEDFAERIAAYPYILEVEVLNREGRLLQSSDIPESTDLNQSADANFIFLRNSNDEEMRIGRPSPFNDGEHDGSYMVVSMRITENTRFMGIVKAVIDLNYFNRYFLDVNQTFGMNIVMVNAAEDNKILASTFYSGQGLDNVTGKSLSNFGYFEGPIGYMPESGETGVVIRDTGDAILGLHSLAPWPAVVGVAFPKDQLFTNWFGNVTTLIVTTLAFMGVLFVLIRVNARNTQYQKKIEQALEANRANLEYRVKRRTSELRAERDKAEIANKAKSVTLGRVSHELRTPLTSIMGFSEVIRDRAFGDDLDRYSQYAGYVHDSGEYMRRMVEDVLDLSKIDTGKYRLREDKFHIGTLISDCVNATRKPAKIKDVRIDSYLHGPDYYLFADRRAIRQVLMNLLSNALKFNKRGGAITINFGLDPSGGGATISIEDNGIGIREDDLPTIMEPMTRSSAKKTDPRNSDESGTGLGLPVVKSLIELHGGEVNIVSEENEGTTVYLNLPETRVMDIDTSV